MSIYVFDVFKTLFKILCCKKFSVFKTMRRKLMELIKSLKYIILLEKIQRFQE